VLGLEHVLDQDLETENGSAERASTRIECIVWFFSGFTTKELTSDNRLGFSSDDDDDDSVSGSAMLWWDDEAKRTRRNVSDFFIIVLLFGR
jgi:hypothetical protein